MCRISFGPSSVLRIVVKRLLARGTRPAERQMPGRRSIAKKNICRRVTRLHSGEPRSNHCGNVLECPWKSERTSTEKNQHHWLSGSHNFLKQLLLAARKHNPGTGSRFAGHRGCVFTKRKHHHIGVLCHANSTGDVTVRS